MDVTEITQGLTAFDIGVLIIVGISAITAFRKGFTTTALSFGAWGLALVTSVFGYTYAQDQVRTWVQPDGLADILGLVGIFLISLFLFKLLADFIGGMVKDSFVGFLDRSLGALFGLLRGLVFVSALWLVFTKLISPADHPDWVKKASLKPFVSWGAEMLESYAAELLGKDPRSGSNDMIRAAADKVSDQFQPEKLEELAGKYPDKAREELKKLLEKEDKKDDDDET